MYSTTHYFHITQLINQKDDLNTSVVSSFCTFLLAERWLCGQEKHAITHLLIAFGEMWCCCTCVQINSQIQQKKPVSSLSCGPCARGATRGCVGSRDGREHRPPAANACEVQHVCELNSISLIECQAATLLTKSKIRLDFILRAIDEILVNLKRREVHQASVLSCSEKPHTSSFTKIASHLMKTQLKREDMHCNASSTFCWRRKKCYSAFKC